ncbi:MAG: Rieske (2Fe-2S) protein [Phycisphaeraceae bacterium]
MPPRKHDDVSQAPDGRPMSEQPKWRQDFPIDVPQDNYVSRRDFTKFMVLTSGAFVVGQAWIGFHNLMRRARGKPVEQAIASLDDVPVGTAMSFRYPSYEHCLLLRPDDQTLVAYNSKCTHLHCPVRPQMEDNTLQCPCHSGYFDLHSGRPVAGPPRRPLHRITLEVRDNVIYATGVEVQTV